MAFEWRGNNFYYYEKERIGGKVRSVYVGNGETAFLINQMRLLKKLEINEKKRLIKDQISQQNEIETILDSFADHSKILTDAFFLTNGFHQHKRQWRKNRNDR